MTPITCSTEGLKQVVPTAIVNEVHDVAATVCPEPTVDLDNKEVQHLTPALAMSSIDSDTYSITKEVVPLVGITTDIDSKAGMQEFDALSVNTTPTTSEVDHGFILVSIGIKPDISS
ncbi:hypothetical protein D1007_13001 [Hordeum vulgare]|nr:hypothetical protein D1007_13001 [Hordeum vulgare]